MATRARPNRRRRSRPTQPEAQPFLRNSEQSVFTTCRQQWEWSYEDRLQARRTAPQLRFGTLIHKSLERYYVPGTKRGPHPAESFDKLFKEEAKENRERLRQWTEDDEEWLDGRELGIYMLEQYVKRYEGPDSEYRVIASEHTFQVPIVNLLPPGRRLPANAPSLVVGTFDGVWQSLDSGRLFFKEFKTTVSIQTQHLAMDEQAGRYWALGPPYLNTPYDDFEGILYTFLRKYKPKPDQRINDLGQHLNKDGRVSARQPAPTLHRERVFRDDHDRQEVIRRILNTAYEIAQVRNGKLAVTKTPERPPVTMQCRMCQFRDMCELHEAGQDWEAFRDQTMTHWEPYEAHNLDPHD